ncbi:MAG: dihydrolipoyllysine-residue acetyltransferase [Campylobacteraceae bacterium]|nr:dihydrolipoyllysine-residue acetyltransferase [Campylobacteraceae bacterium]
MNELEEILLPDVGGEEVEIIEITVSNGDSLEEEDAIITVETEKASMDIPAPFSGTLVELKVKVGDKIKDGNVICTMKREGKADLEVSAPAPKVEVEEIKVIETPVEVVEETPAEDSIETVISDVFVPDIGEDGEVDVIEVLVSVGDSISEEDGLFTLETDKATMDVPAPFSGTVKELLVKEGAKVKTGTLVARIEKTIVIKAATTPKKTEAAKEVSVVKATAPAVSVAASSAINENSNRKAHASPSVRRVAREFGVDLSQVKASGPKNRIMTIDIRAYVKESLANIANGSSVSSSKGSGFGFNLPALKTVDFTKFGEIEIKELTKIQKISGPSLHRNYVGMPHVTQFDEADITELENFRKEQNAIAAKKKLDYKISPLVFVLKAVAKALELHPIFNSSLSEDGASVILKKYINIAVAVDTPNGLVVPVIKDVNTKTISQLSKELVEISVKARDGKLKIQDMQGACFTISSLGGIGGTAFTPIINAPEVAILGVSKSKISPVWNGSEFEPKLMLPLSLSYDHRVIDGAEGARFSTTVSNILSDIRLIVL